MSHQQLSFFLLRSKHINTLKNICKAFPEKYRGFSKLNKENLINHIIECNNHITDDNIMNILEYDKKGNFYYITKINKNDFQDPMRFIDNIKNDGEIDDNKEFLYKSLDQIKKEKNEMIELTQKYHPGNINIIIEYYDKIIEEKKNG